MACNLSILKKNKHTVYTNIILYDLFINAN